MKIKNEKEQIIERITKLDESIIWQNITLRSAKRRYEIKRDWLISFWITTSVDTLRYFYESKKEIRDSLQEYRDHLSDRLIKL